MGKHFPGPGRPRGLQRVAICASAGAATLLSACAAMPASPPPAPVSSAASPVLGAVATGPLNLPVAVATPQGPGTVTVLSDYISGEGEECRAYALAAGGAAATKLACRDGAAWRDIPPLTPQANAGGLP